MKVKLIAFTDVVGSSLLTIGKVYEVTAGPFCGTVAIFDDENHSSELYEGEYEVVADE